MENNISRMENLIGEFCYHIYMATNDIEETKMILKDGIGLTDKEIDYYAGDWIND